MCMRSVHGVRVRGGVRERHERVGKRRHGARHTHRLWWDAWHRRHRARSPLLARWGGALSCAVVWSHVRPYGNGTHARFCGTEFCMSQEKMYKATKGKCALGGWARGGGWLQFQRLGCRFFVRRAAKALGPSASRRAVRRGRRRRQCERRRWWWRRRLLRWWCARVGVCGLAWPIGGAGGVGVVAVVEAGRM